MDRAGWLDCLENLNQGGHERSGYKRFQGNLGPAHDNAICKNYCGNLLV